MGTSEKAMITIKNTLEIVNNSILILKDLDQLFEKEGFLPTDTKIGCEPSRDINQNSNSYLRFFPLFMSRYYYNGKVDEGEKQDQYVIGVNIQFYHRQEKLELIPSLSATLIKLPRLFSKMPRPEAWWVKYTLFEDKDRLAGENFQHQTDFILDGRKYTFTNRKHNKINNHTFTFWGYELMDVKNAEFLQDKYVSRLIDEYNSVSMEM
ncbi:hypothetical protein V1499_18405 [Neobacillus sp. SCS-31]|uniref:hypothetical protein n=1 Tax=Neobacillus oceani TaxID=3115292 RepID=UPI00390642FB